MASPLTFKIGISWQKFLLNFCALALFTSIVIILLTMTPVKRRGFSCDDKSIQHPFHSSTVPTAVLAAFSLCIPISVMAITEYFSHHHHQHENHHHHGTRYHFLNFEAPIWLPCLYQSVTDFLLGMWLNEIVTNIGKVFVGRLRPNFIDMCGPIITGVGGLDHLVQSHPCSNNDQSSNFVENYVCSKSQDDSKQNRLSFPSGHAAMSAYAMVYAVIYIQIRVRAVKSGKKGGWLKFFKMALQIGLLFLSAFTAVSRVMDNKHHATDVLAGVILGSSMAFMTARFLAGLLNPMVGDPVRRLAVSGVLDLNGKNSSS